MNIKENPAVIALLKEWEDYQAYFGDIGKFSGFITLVYKGLVHKKNVRMLGDYEQFLYDNLLPIFNK